MRTVVFALAVAAACASAAHAQDTRLSDADFVKMSECAGYAHGLKTDAGKFDAVLKAQSRGRTDQIGERADGVRDSAESRARAAKGAAREQIESELQGACAALAG
jgi:hypothetical protein